MEIKPPRSSLFDIQALKSELERFVALASTGGVRPCAGCERSCDDCHSHSCTHFCTTTCLDACSKLSTDPLRYPIERGVFPLVLQLAQMDCFQPCWSCEGHLGGHGEVWKIPQVYFYAKSPLCVQILVKHLVNLSLDNQTHFNWHIRLLYLSNPAFITYSIEPLILHAPELDLLFLHRDLLCIAENLPAKLSNIANEILLDMRKSYGISSM